MTSFTLALSMLVSAHAQNVFNVPTGQPDVQTAINNANNGDTIRFTGLVFQDFNVTGKSLNFEATSFDYGYVGTMTVSGGADVTLTDMRLAGGITNTDPALVELGVFCQGTTSSAIDAVNSTVTLVGVEGECYDSGVIVADDTDLTIIDSEFRYNYYQGVVKHTGADLFIQDSVFEYNAGTGDGGAVASSGSLTHVEGTTFYANSTTLGGGAGIWAASDTIELFSNEFLNNYDLIWFIPGIVISDPSDLYGVSGEVAGLTVGIGEGAGAYVTDPPSGDASVDIHNNTFCGNLADAGAGLYIDDVKAVTVQNNRFAENWSMHYGGAMYIESSEAWLDNERAYIVNNTFMLNTAGKIPPPFLPLVTVIGGGGAVGVEGTILDFRNNIVARTPFGGGLMGVDGPDYTIGDLLTMDYNIFYNNCDGGTCSETDPLTWQNFTGDLNQISLSATNIELDPFPTYFGAGEFNCFPDAFYPEWTSPAVRNGDVEREPNRWSTLFSDIGAYGGPRADVLDRDGDEFENIYDCNDEPGAGAAVHPGAPEICDQLDNNCDGEIDEGFPTLWYTDSDGDGFGDVNQIQPNVTCAVPVGEVQNRDDCDDGEATVNPSAVEICDELDNNCDFAVNGGLPFIPLWQDLDGDNYGDGEQTNGCSAQDGNNGYYLQEGGAIPRLVVSGYVPNEDDCNDFNANISPVAEEICDDLDNDCNDLIDDARTGGELYYTDGDADGYGAEGEGVFGCEPPTDLSVTLGGDCDDFDPTISPGVEETCDGIDNDCDGTTDQEAIDAPLLYEDLDNDGIGNPATGSRDCNPGEGYTTAVGGDCDDNDPTIKECAECGCRSTPTPLTGLAGLLALGLVVRRRRS